MRCKNTPGKTHLLVKQVTVHHGKGGENSTVLTKEKNFEMFGSGSSQLKHKIRLHIEFIKELELEPLCVQFKLYLAGHGKSTSVDLPVPYEKLFMLESVSFS